MPKPSQLKIPDFGMIWPAGTPLLRRHVYCAYHNRGKGSFYHRKELIRAFWPEETFSWHDWSERRMKATCSYDLVTWIGAGATGKSTDAAAQVIEWWLEAPFESGAIVCSTTIKMLRLRIWSEIARLFCALPKAVEFRDEEGNVIEQTKMGYIGELVDSDLMVRWKQGDNKHAIFGLGVNEGSVAEAMSNLVGIHPKRLWLVLDELQGIREAIDGAKDNMSKNSTFRCLGMGNTDENMKSLLRRASEPVNGWDSVDVTTADEWETDGGVVAARGLAQRFDGKKSPAVKDPQKFPYLISEKHLNAHLRKAGGNEQDPGYLSQCRAIWPSVGLQSTVLDDQIITKFHCHDSIFWTDGFEHFAALDPAFTDGGDRKILQFGKFGFVTNDDGARWVIEFGDWVDVPIDSRSDDPIHYQIVHFCRDACVLRGVSNDQFSADTTGEGGGLAAIFSMEWGPITEIEFGGRPSDTPYDATRTARDVYDRRVTELNHNLRQFAIGNGIRGLSKPAAQQACARRTMFKNKKNVVEKKSEMKARTGESPDNLDACCVGAAYVMQQGARPGGEIIASKKADDVMKRLAREGAAMIAESNMLVAQW